MFDFFHIAIALCPLAAYLILIGYIRCRKTPLVVTGGRDIATLAIGISGFIAIGPMELFFPRAAASILGSRVWFLLLLLYVLCVLLVILASRPRLVVYGVSLEDFTAHLKELFCAMDPETKWLGENVQSDSLGISAIVEKAGPGNVCQILAVSHRQSVQGWVMLEKALVQKLYGLPSTSQRGVMYVLYGVCLMSIAASALLFDPPASAQAIRDMLRY